MSFIADKQTVADLQLLGRYKPNSIFSIFNRVRTEGGERLLQEMFRQPLTDPVQINSRSAMFRYFQGKKLRFSFSSAAFQSMERYLTMGTAGNFLTAMAYSAYYKFSAAFLRDEQYVVLQQGLRDTIGVLNAFRDFLDSARGAANNPYAPERDALLRIFGDQRLHWLKGAGTVEAFGLADFAKYDYLLKHTLQSEMERLLSSMHQADVYLAVTEVARANDFGYAVAQPAGEQVMKIEALRHPALPKGVANPLSMDRHQNLLFLTGANMAGKSTFMKSFGIAVYLAHMGFPVAAREMIFSVCDGIYSSINVADDLNLGHSHFYAEVLRVKKVAEEVAAGKNLVVLFDELFKGTNVKDAYDGTLSVTAAFARYRNCFYIVSTHIIEVGAALKAEGEHIRFAFLPTVMEGHVPRYTYQLREGITVDRQGMMIIENEGILEMIRAN